MKTRLILLTSLFVVVVFSCKKKDNPTPSTTQGVTNNDNYSSINDFYAKNGVATQLFYVDAVTGGSFTTSKGTKVIIPPNAFYNNGAVTGQIKIEFKDIYDKSDMLLSNVSTDWNYGLPLKSAGEFFIRATSNGQAVNLLSPLTIKQPAKNGIVDPAMQPFVLLPAILTGGDTLKNPGTWVSGDSAGYINDSVSQYAFSLYQFNQPADSGSWCNSDNSSYFSAYPQTSLTINPSTNVADSVVSVSVFLVFKDIDCMVHVYQGSGGSFPYSYAPQGLSCTAVAVGINKKGKVFSSFTPITISANQSVSSTLSATTTSAFITQLKALN